MTLGLEPEREAPGIAVVGEARLVEVAIDAAGAGGAKPYTYAVPDRLAELEEGEAVLVEFRAGGSDPGSDTVPDQVSDTGSDTVSDTGSDTV